MPKKSLALSEFVKMEELEEARLRDLSTPMEAEKSTFDMYYEFLSQAFQFANALIDPSQKMNRQQASSIVQQYNNLFDDYANKFNHFAQINPEQEIKYTSFIDLLRSNERKFNEAINKQTSFVPVYSNNPGINASIAQKWHTGSMSYTPPATSQPVANTPGVVPVSRRSDAPQKMDAFSNTIIPLDRK